jgi:hypothetical protein
MRQISGASQVTLGCFSGPVPPVFMKAGDIVEIKAKGIGVLQSARPNQ